MLGFSAAPSVPKESARVASFAALKDHKAKRWDAARQGLLRALELDPSYDLARFNLACVLSALGQHADVARELQTLLERDLPRFLPRLLGDEDLAPFRASPSGQALVAAAEALRLKWLAAAKAGAAVVAWAPARERSLEDRMSPIPTTSSLHPEILRLGAWLAAEHRFLPLVGDAPSVLAGSVDVLRGRALLLHGGVDDCQSDFCPRLDARGVSYHPSLLSSSRALQTAPVVLVGDEMVQYSLSAELAERGPRWVVGDKPHGWEWDDLQESKARATNGSWQTGEQITVSAGGSLLSGLPAGWKYTAGSLQLPTGTRCKLGKTWNGDHLLVAEVPGRARAVLVSTDAHCICEETEDSVFRHKLAVIDTLSCGITPWLQGEMGAAVRIGPDASVYLQRHTLLERYADVDERTNPESLPAGLLLTPPQYGDGNCCGL